MFYFVSKIRSAYIIYRCSMSSHFSQITLNIQVYTLCEANIESAQQQVLYITYILYSFFICILCIKRQSTATGHFVMGPLTLDSRKYYIYFLPLGLCSCADRNVSRNIVLNPKYLKIITITIIIILVSEWMEEAIDIFIFLRE